MNYDGLIAVEILDEIESLSRDDLLYLLGELEVHCASENITLHVIDKGI